MKVPDRDGRVENVSLACSDFAEWLENSNYFGSTVGRFGNRIAGGKFSLDGEDYQLETNNEPGDLPCHLHGGVKGFNRVMWSGQPVQRPGAVGICFTYYSDAGEEGYPGNLTAKVTYWLNEANELVYEVFATTDAACPVNLINHAYWNLSGNHEEEILTHELSLNASTYLPTNRGLIPTGEKAPVEGTPMDFRQAAVVGARMNDDFQALKLANGYDHCWIIDQLNDEEERDQCGLLQAATLYDPKSGRVMEVFTDHPSVQFYAGNFLPKRTGLCLETQGFPDAPNQPGFPDAILKPGEKYAHKTIHRFSTK